MPENLLRWHPWYYLPPSVHKILIHASLPIGELSEKTAEAKNKAKKQCRLQHTRKILRTASNTDLLNRLFLSSDPHIAAQRSRFFLLFISSLLICSHLSNGIHIFSTFLKTVTPLLNLCSAHSRLANHNSQL